MNHYLFLGILAITPIATVMGQDPRGTVDIGQMLASRDQGQGEMENLVLLSRVLTETYQRPLRSQLYSSALKSDFTYPFVWQIAPFIRDTRLQNQIANNFLRWEHGDKIQATALVTKYYRELRRAIREAADDPRLSLPFVAEANRSVVPAYRIKQILKKLDSSWKNDMAVLSNCIGRIPQTSAPLDLRSALDRGSVLRLCLGRLPQVPRVTGLGETSFASFDISEEIPFHPGVVVSTLGFIPGNEIRIYNESPQTSDEVILQLMEWVYRSVVATYKERFAERSVNELAKEFEPLLRQGLSEGFNPIIRIFLGDSQPIPGFLSLNSHDLIDPSKHPIWINRPSLGTNQTLPALIKDIQESRSSIYFNVFFNGGTLGLTIANVIWNKVISDPNFRVVMMQDLVNHFGHAPEMRPIFALYRAMMLVFPNQVLALPSPVTDKSRTGLPYFLSSLISEDFVRSLKLEERFPLNVRAQSDHSKTIIIDGDRRFVGIDPIIWVGSKNLTDKSGALCNDEVARIKGPAAVAGLQLYLPDMREALKRNSEDPAIQGVANAKRLGCPDFGADTPICEFVLSSDRLKVPAAGVDVVRFAENNADATIVEPIHQNLSAINGAKRQILINEQLLYDPATLEALARAVKRGVAVHAILESFEGEASPIPLMPNALFLEELLQAGIRLRWKVHGHSPIFIPEHHGKTLSVDGFDQNLSKVAEIGTLIVGSANKDILTMRGGFRELQVESFSPEAQLVHDRLFWRNWTSVQETRPVDLSELEQGPLAAELKSQNTSVREFLFFIRSFVLALYTAQIY